MLDLFQQFYDWFSDLILNGITDFLVYLISFIISLLTSIILKGFNFIALALLPKISGLQYDDYEYATQVKDLWNSLPVGFLQLASTLQVPECFSVLTTATIVRYIKRKIPFIGK